MIRTAGNPAQLEPAIREEIRRLDPRVVVRHVRPIEQDVDASLAKRRFVLTLLALFGALAALLTAAGIYGLLAYSVNARLREFGVRAAIGATRGDLVAMILREAATLALPGLAAARVFLALLVLASAWLPARRAAGVALGTALRTE